MRLTMRPYANENDFGRVRDFLPEVSLVFEPVGTHPAHQQRGLGKAVMTGGLRRAERLGATLATVGSYSAATHALYGSLGFTEFDLSVPWKKAY